MMQSNFRISGCLFLQGHNCEKRALTLGQALALHYCQLGLCKQTVGSLQLS